MTKRHLRLVLLVGCVSCSWPSWGLDLHAHKDLQLLIDELVRDHKFDEQQLRSVFARVTLRPNVVAAMQRPYEAKPWYVYRGLFVTEANVANGVRFWRQHRTALRNAEGRYGVPASVIVAIIGIETRYGRLLGRHPVIDSLTTLVLQYPRRSKYFRKELKQFLLLSQEEGLDPLLVKGSYAGAMGIPQFLASSYRAYAVDFSGDGKRDLITQPVDAIGSVANYLSRHRWRVGEPVAAMIQVAPGTDIDGFVNRKLAPKSSVKRMREGGVKLPVEISDKVQGSLVELEMAGGRSEYRAAFKNFYVITRYNQSIHYAMAVYELSRALEQAVLIPPG